LAEQIRIVALTATHVLDGDSTMLEHHLIGSDHFMYAFERQVPEQGVHKRKFGAQHAPKQGELQRIDV
jgi:hypothetical protein